MKTRFGFPLSLILVSSGLFSPSIFAGSYLAQNVTITKVGNIDQNQDKFFVNVSGGQVTCPVITFTVAAAPSQKAFDRAFALAITAYTTGKRVSIYNYGGTSCSEASYIEIYD